MNKEQIQDWLVTRVAAALKLKRADIDLEEPFARHGIDSVVVVAISGDLERWLGRRLSPTLLFEYPTIDSLSRYLAEGRPKVGDEAPAQGGAHEPIAIVGLACRLPGAADARAFWTLLSSGVDAIQEVGSDRWSLEDLYDADPTAPGKMSTRWGGFIDGVDQFDPGFFGIAPREALEMDPQQRLLLEVAWEALEDAGIPARKIARRRVGVFVGISHSDHGAAQREASDIGPLTGVGSALSIAANRLSYVFDLRGPSMAVDTACSSSLVAVHLACRSLRSGESSLALVAGSNLVLSPALAVSFTKAGLMASDGRCKTFDASADGYVRGEGVGVVVLKPLSRALEDGDSIYGVIKGTAVSQDGRSNGLMAPNPQAQESVIRDACADANVDPASIQYVEAHGTGTSLGDSIELRSLGAVVSAGRRSDRPCLVGSVKTNIGHLEAAAGITSLIKVALMMKHASIPPSLHFERPNPTIPFDELRLRVPVKLEPWSSSEGPRRAAISSFGFGGTNANVVLEAVPETEEPLPASDTGVRLLPISARSERSLDRLASSYATLLAPPDAPRWSDVVFSTSARREHHSHRLAVVASSTPEASELLRRYVSGTPLPGVVSGNGKKRVQSLALVFSGQGTQWSGMGRELSATFPVCRAVLERVDQEIRKHASWSLLDELESSRLEDTEIAQPAVFAVQVAVAELLLSWGIVPKAVVGHSVGEIAAAHVAGVLSLEDAVRIVVHRGRLMQRGKGDGAMAAIALSARAVDEEIEAYAGRVSIAAFNGRASTVIAGEPAAVEEVVTRLEKRGVFARPLGVPYAFHTNQMDALVPGLIESIRGIEPRKGSFRLVSSVTGAVIEPRHLHVEYWARNMREPVAFHRAIETLIEEGSDAFLEIGPHPALISHIEDAQRAVGHEAAAWSSLRRGEAAQGSLFRALATLYVHGCVSDLGALSAEKGKLVALPTYPWNHDRFSTDRRPLTAPPSSALGHPFLGRRLSLAGSLRTHVFQTTPGAEHSAWLSDHKAGGLAVLPATAYFDLLVAARAEISGHVSTIEAVELHEMLMIDDGPLPTFQTVATEHDGGVSFEVYTRHSEREAWTLRASARAEIGARAVVPPRQSVEEARLRCFEPVALGALYQALGERGLDYGPAFRGLGEVWRRSGEAIGHVQLPEALAVGATRHLMHPALLDACLHVIAPALATVGVERDGPRMMIPTRLERMRIFRKAPGSVWSRVTVRPENSDPALVVVDVSVLAEDGELVADLTGFTLRRLSMPRGAAACAVEDGMSLYRIDWKPAASATTRTDAGGAGDRWLILTDEGGVGARLSTALERRGAVCVQVARSNSKGGSGPLAVDPRSPDEIRRLVQDRLGPGQPPWRGILHLWSLDAPAEDAVNAANLTQAQELGVGSALTLVQALALARAESPKLWLVTRGAVHVAGVGSAVAQSPIWGLGKAITFEQPELVSTLVDLDPGDEGGSLEALVEMLSAGEAEYQVAVRRGARHVPRLVPTALDVSSASPLAVTRDATYLVTGGLGALGMVVAEWLVRRGAGHLVLLGRNGPKPEVHTRIEKMRQSGANIVVAAVNVADPIHLAATLEAARTTMPPIRGVVHAAGVLDDGALLDLSRERLRAVLAPKVQGGWNLHDLTRTDPLDFFVLFSSAVSVLGSPGQANYIVANTFSDALAHARRAAGLPAVSINWGPWAEAGLAAETARQAEEELRAHLVKMISPDRGVDLLGKVMQDGTAQVTILPFDIRNVLQFFPEGAGVSFFSDVLREELQALKAEPGGKRLYARPELSQEYVAPRDNIERIIVGIWQRALTLDRVGVNDDFFELGGDSVFAGQIVSQINKAFGVTVSLRAAFTSVTVAHLAKLVQDLLLAKVEEMSDAEAESLLLLESA